MHVRALPVLFLLSALACGSAAALETRTFIIANQADGYGVDQCLAKGERCGLPAATAYCQSHNYAKAASYRRIERDEITGAVPQTASLACGGLCNAIAIECTR